MEDSRLALVQICPEKGKPEENGAKIISFMKEAKDENADLAVFPECSLTGYDPQRSPELALEKDCIYIQEIEAAADELGMAVCFGFMERDEDALYISQEFYCKGEKTLYRKTHLATREEEYFKEGNDFPTAEYRHITIGMQLCWESHIPQISTVYRKKGAHLLLFPYASGMSGEKCKTNLSIHLPARASDNGCFAAACNLLAEKTGGGLAVWDYKGKLIAEYFGDEEKLLLCDLGGILPREFFSAGISAMHTLSYFDTTRDIF